MQVGSRARTLLTVGLATTVITLAATGLASRPRLHLQRIDAAAFPSTGKVRLTASLVELEGDPVGELPASAFQLSVDGQPAGAAESVAPFSSTKEPLDLVLVVESSALYGPPPPPPPPIDLAPPQPIKKGKAGKHKSGKTTAKPVVPAPPPPPTGAVPLDRVKDAISHFLESVPPSWRVLVIDYGGDVNAHPPFQSASAAGAAVDEVSPDEESGDLRLGDAVRAALRELGKTREARKLIVLVSDGLNAQMDRRVFRTLGDAARAQHVPISAIAFSPSDDRVPLINLGELAKRSFGTFRWAPKADDLSKQVDALADELSRSYVLTFALPVRALAGHKLVVRANGVTSNVLTWDADDVKRNLPWWAWLAFAVGAIAAAFAVRELLRRRRASAPAQSKPPAQPQRAQPQAQPQRAQPHAQPQRVLRATLIVVTGSAAGQRVSVDAQPIELGKATAWRIDDPSVSGRHARVSADAHGFIIADLGSTNGTFVNGRKVDQPTRLTDGDLIALGQTQLKFRLEGG